MALVLVASLAIVGLQATTARTDVVVTLYNGNAGGAGTGSANMDFTGLSQVATFNYYAPAFGIDSSAGGANNTNANNWTPTFNGTALSTNFSARVIGQISVASFGVYTFSTTSDDGSILKINGNTVVNNNFNQGPTTRTGNATLAPGIYNVEIQYNQMGGGRSLDVGSGTSITKLPAGVTWVNQFPQLQVQVFSDPGSGTNTQRFNQTTGALQNPNTPLVGTFTAPAINFESATGNLWSPSGLLSQALATNYAVDITGTLKADKDGMFTFKLTSDDGSFLFIDGNLVVNDGGFHGPQDAFGTVFLTAGNHPFEVRFFQGGGGAGVDLTLPAGISYVTPQQVEAGVPEPSSLALLALGLSACCAACGWRRWRRKA
jgi:hypothetical protein